jgi:hypothetical protein
MNRLLILSCFSASLSAASASAAAAAAPSPSPCYAVLDGAVGLDSITAIETVCATTLFDYRDATGMRLALRSYPAAAAFVVESSSPDDPGSSFSDQIFFTSSFLFQYLTGGNAQKANLSATALTAPFTLRPPVAGRSVDEDWVGTMALAPSVWHASGKKQPPASTIPVVDVSLFGGVTMAVRPVVLAAPPIEDDFRHAFAELELYLAFLPLPGRWVINTTSPLTPSFNFFFTQFYNGSTWMIEAAAEVFHTT